jgi:hypothetical protein
MNNNETKRVKKILKRNSDKRKISLISKADDLYRFFRADVFFAIRKKGRYYTYISVVNPY